MYSEIIRDLSPKIDFAEHNAIENTAGILASPTVVRHLCESLESEDARALLSNELIAQVLNGVAISPVRRAPRSHIIPKSVMWLVPERLRMYKKRMTQPRSLDNNLLALRAYIVVAMDRRLKADACAFVSKSNFQKSVVPANAKIQSGTSR
ncbi:MAG: hypothetical protein IPK65_06835 [Gammaproteobacteria bacterium]|nr:hypothetical protein [Gammaproteobacteria bacterium]